MSYASFSDEVAEDYRKALEDLTMNSRYEISNLTVIAKENTEHALPISDALKNHIKMCPPSKKLPAFYVLDSVVKNVGTPYTIFLGRNLYSTFMEAYALSDPNVRRKMEEMLKTWKEPVPGSIDARPVFPVEITRPIESALIKARTSALQAQQEYARGQPQIMRQRPGVGQVPYRQTPTPPNVQRPSQYPPPGYPAPQERGFPQQLEQGYGGPQYTQQQSHQQQFNGQSMRASPAADPRRAETPNGVSYMPQQYPRPVSATPSWQQQQQQQPPAQTYAVPDAGLESLKSDIARLISVSRNDFAQNFHDSSIQKKLKALLDLQTVLQTQKLPPDQIAAVRAQVDKLSAPATPQLPPAPVPQPPPQQQPTQGPTLSSLLGQNGLAALLARSSATPQPPPSVQPQQAALRSPQVSYNQPYAPPPAVAPPPADDPSSLLAKLRAAGLLPASPAPPVATPISLPNALAGKIPPGFPPSLPFIGTGYPRGQTDLPNDVELKPQSLKMPRPHLISMLYERLGQPCTQCGRRFQTDEEGKKKKAAHMDWHFRIHQRMAEAEKRGQHRSWYVDELDWIKSRESADDHLATDSNGTTAAGSDVAKAAPKLQYISAPDNPPNKLCPICQEEFEAKWLDDAQDFVWMDAIKIGGRIYHASCHKEATKDTPVIVSRSTPDPESVLGKRKNEDEHLSMRTKIKSEPVA